MTIKKNVNRAVQRAILKRVLANADVITKQRRTRRAEMEMMNSF